MNATTTIDQVLDKSLHDLGFNPQNGGTPLIYFIKKNDQYLEIGVLSGITCQGTEGRCGSCSKRPHECREVLHDLPKISARRILEKWSRYYSRHKPNFKKGSNTVRMFLSTPLHTLVTRLIENGVPRDYILSQIPASAEIMELGNGSAHA